MAVPKDCPVPPPRFLSDARAAVYKETMATDAAQQRQQAHALLDMLPDEKLAAVRSLLEVMIEPLSSSLASAPVEEEEVAAETAAALDRARASLTRGEGIPHENIRREFDLDK